MLAKGTRIGQYYIDGFLDRGGMSDVYLAHREDEVARQVALKILRGQDPKTADRFTRECRILSLLEHPNIARIYDAGTTEDGSFWLSMELVDGLPINLYCSKNTLSIRARMRLLALVSDAVAYAHQCLVIHRDLKPGNIFVDRNGQPKLLDFGISGLVDPSSGTLHTTTQWQDAMLTPEYAAPEQIRAEKLGAACDVYALGVITHQLLCGVRPYDFENRNPLDVARIVCEQIPTPPSRVIVPTRDLPYPVRAIGVDLDMIVAKAMRKDARERYHSAEAFASDIRNYLEGRPVKARPPNMLYLTRKFLRRHRLGNALFLGFLTMLFVFLGVLWKQRNEVTLERDRAEQQRQMAEDVTSMLVDLFKTTGEKGTRVDMKVGDMVERGEALLAMADTQQPMFRARLLEALGTIHFNLADYDRAIDQYREAADIYRDQGALERLVGVLILQADAINVRRNFSGRLDLLDELWVLLKSHFPDRYDWLARAHDLTANLALGRGDRVGAEREFREALALRHLVSPEAQFWGVLNNYGNMLTYLGRFEEAEPLLADAVAMMRVGNPVPWDQFMIPANHARVLHSSGRSEEAERLMLALLPRCLEVFEENHPLVGYYHNLLAMIYGDRGDNQRAMTHAKEGLRINISQHGEQHSETITSRVQLGRALGRMGRFQEGEEQLRMAFQHHMAFSGGDEGSGIGLLVVLARLLHLADKKEDALHLFIRVQNLLPDETNPGYFVCHLFLADLQFDMGLRAEAEQNMKRCKVFLERQPLKDKYLFEMARLAFCLAMAKGEIAVAEAAIVTIETGLQRRPHEGVFFRAELRNMKAALAGAAGRAEARNELFESLEQLAPFGGSVLIRAQKRTVKVLTAMGFDEDAATLKQRMDRVQPGNAVEP